MSEKPTGQYAPLSAWAYFGLQILFSLPIVGLVFLIIFSISKGNLNRRSFARSYWCVYVVLLVLIIVLAVLGATILPGLDVQSILESMI